MKKNSKIRIIAVVFSLIIISGGFWYFFKKQSTNNYFSRLHELNRKISQENILGGSTSLTDKTLTAPQNLKEYKNGKYGFSFDYPKEFTMAEFVQEEKTDVVLIQNMEKSRGFQIAISPFDEELKIITPERILRDIPSMKIIEAKEISFAGIKALAFLSDNGGPEPDREIWFVRKGYLHQISAFKSNDGLLEEVLKSWEFND